MRVTWHIRPSRDSETGANVADAAAVTIEHEFERPIPLIGTELIPRIVDRFFTHAIATRTLARFRELAERSEPTSSLATNFLS